MARDEFPGAADVDQLTGGVWRMQSWEFFENVSENQYNRSMFDVIVIAAEIC